VARRRHDHPKRSRRTIPSRHSVKKPVRGRISNVLVAVGRRALLWAVIVGALGAGVIAGLAIRPEHPMFVCYAAAPGMLICAPVPREEIKPLVPSGQ
jgi:hypothetical protein